MKLLNSLTHQVEDIEPSKKNNLSIYSCGPTVYNSAHIGNLMSYIVADTIARVARSSGLEVNHVMNITDIDDKTIKASECHKCPDGDHNGWLKNYTTGITNKFYEDLDKLNINRDNYKFTLATDYIDSMIKMISDLEEAGIAYAADDGLYFSIDKYKQSGKKYGQLVNITAQSTGAARIDNDEYDKESIHDFALWKKRTEKEPYWTYKSSKTTMDGRPGWHIECSAMSASTLGLPFDIHTGGVDLRFPHHENEIAQSTAITEGKMANYFIHSEHLLVDGKKMSKSLKNFYTLEDIVDKGYDPLAFRMLVLRSKYNRPTNFTWEALDEAQEQLYKLRELGDRWYQEADENSPVLDQDKIIGGLKSIINDDLNTPKFISYIFEAFDKKLSGEEFSGIDDSEIILRYIDNALGLDIMTRGDITKEHRKLIDQRNEAKNDNNYTLSDKIRDQLKDQSIGVRDSDSGTTWYRLYK